MCKKPNCTPITGSISDKIYFVVKGGFVVRFIDEKMEIKKLQLIFFVVIHALLLKLHFTISILKIS